MGNLNKKSFEEIWCSGKANKVREMVKNCSKNCWMIGTANLAMRKHFWKPTIWVIRNKISSILK